MIRFSRAPAVQAMKGVIANNKTATAMAHTPTTLNGAGTPLGGTSAGGTGVLSFAMKAALRRFSSSAAGNRMLKPIKPASVASTVEKVSKAAGGVAFSISGL